MDVHESVLAYLSDIVKDDANVTLDKTWATRTFRMQILFSDATNEINYDTEVLYAQCTGQDMPPRALVRSSFFAPEHAPLFVKGG